MPYLTGGGGGRNSAADEFFSTAATFLTSYANAHASCSSSAPNDKLHRLLSSQESAASEGDELHILGKRSIEDLLQEYDSTESRVIKIMAALKKVDFDYEVELLWEMSIEELKAVGITPGLASKIFNVIDTAKKDARKRKKARRIAAAQT